MNIDMQKLAELGFIEVTSEGETSYVKTTIAHDVPYLREHAVDGEVLREGDTVTLTLLSSGEISMSYADEHECYAVSSPEGMALLYDVGYPRPEVQHQPQAPLVQEKDAIQRRDEALEIASRFGGTDEPHHKSWVIDQMCRALLGSEYEAWVAKRKDDGYDWDVGITP
ncbi:hypothetical protein ACYPKM_02265 [Pseudomonas aeruginosa]